MTYFKLKNNSIKCLIYTVLFFSSPVFAQNILISTGGTVNVNGGEIFLDAGGAAGNDGNTNGSITLCPNTPGQKVCADFTMFNTYYDVTNFTSGYGDSLCVFDGTNKIATLTGNYGTPWSNASAPTPVGIGNSTGLGAVTSPGIFCSNNTTGCLTFNFYNIDPALSPGWSANISTYAPLGTPGCSINLTASSNTICSGATVTLTANGSVVTAGINNDFNSSTVGTGWQSTSSATFPNNACGKPSLDNSTYLWMASQACPRALTSNGLNVANGGVVSFEYRQADVNGNASPCEAPDINMSGSTPESVFLQYSINGGTTWNTMKVMFPHDLKCSTCDNYNGIGYSVRNWNKITVPIPTAAKTANTMFRWIMPLCTSASTDNWGLDNVIISSTKPSTMTLTDVTHNVSLGTTTNTAFSITQTPTVTTVYQAVITDGTSTCTSSQTITVNTGTLPVTSFSYNPTYCSTTSNASPTLAIGFTSGGTFSSSPVGLTINSTNGNVTISSSTSGTYAITYTVPSSGCSNVASSTTSFVIIPSPTVTVNSGTYCAGGSLTLTANGASNYSWTNASGLNTTTGSVVIANPTSSTVYTVTGSNSGCTNTNTSSVSVAASPTLAVNSGSYCSGGSLTLTANGASTYSWTNATGLNTTSGNIVIANPTSSTIYTVTGSALGCSSSATTAVTVVALPTISVNSGSFCAGSSLTLTANGASTYSWANSSGLNTTSGNVVIANPSSNSIYTVTGTSQGCANTATTSVSVTAIPTIAVTSGSVCNGSSVTLTASGANTYSWSNSSGLNTTIGNVVIANPSSTTVYTVTGTTSGCAGTNTTLVTVVPSPSVNSVITQSATCGLSNGAATINVNPSATSFTWSSGVTSTTNSASGLNAGTYTVQLSNGTCNTSTVISILSGTAPIIAVTGNSMVCIGNSATLTATGAANYTWNPGSTTSSSVIVTPTASISYTLLGGSGNCTNTAVYTLNVTNIPTVTATSGSVCNGSSITLSALGATSYTWNEGTTNSSLIVTPTSDITYTVIGETANCTNSAIASVSVVNSPTISLPNQITITPGSSTQLNLNTDATTYQWSPPQGLSCTNCDMPIASPQVNTQYCVLTSIDGCTATACIQVNVEIDCNKNYDYSTPTAFTPNNDGNNDSYCLKGWDNCIKNFYIAIFNRWGEKVYDSSDPTFCWDGTFLGAKLDPAVFAFYIKAETTDGKSINKKGNITLIR